MGLKRFAFPGVLGLALYFAVFGGEYSVLEARGADSDLEAASEELPAVRAEIDSLRARIEALENDDEALERFARERYGLIRDGEYLYRLSDPDTARADEGN